MIKMFLPSYSSYADLYEVLYDESGKEKSVTHIAKLTDFERVLMVFEDYDNCTSSDILRRIIREDESLRLHKMSIESMKDSPDAVLHVLKSLESGNANPDDAFSILTEEEMYSAIEKGELPSDALQEYKKIQIYSSLYGRKNVIYADGYFNSRKERIAPIEYFFATGPVIIRTDILKTDYVGFPIGINDYDHWDDISSNSKEGITISEYDRYLEMFKKRFKLEKGGYVDGTVKAYRAIMPKLKY